MHDQLERFGAPRSTWHGQLELPFQTQPSDAPLTRPLGADGWIVFRAAHREVHILHVEWPTELVSEDFTRGD